MGGLGTCPCCKEWKDLTEHYDKELKVKVMICSDCHDVIEEYIKIQAKCGKKTKSKSLK
jgi:hypothetical protein